MKRTLLLSCLVVALNAFTNSGFSSSRAFEIKRHNVNQVEMCISNFGIFGQHESGCDYTGCWWPCGTGRNYIQTAGIWFGTIDSITGDTLVSSGCYSFEFVPGLKDMDINDPNAIIFVYPENWPPPADTFPMAPQDIVSHQDSWCCFNDCDSTYHALGDTRPIGIEIYQTVYAWNYSGIDDAIFFTYVVKNVSEYNIHNCYFGVFADVDIANEISGGRNDICSAIIERMYIIGGDTILIDDLGYQWQMDPVPGWDPPYPGTIGFDLLQTPFDLVEGQDKDGDGIPDQYERDSVYYWNNLPDSLWDVDNDSVPDWRDASENPQLDMTAFKRIDIPAFPEYDIEKYMMLAGYDFQTGQYVPYDTIPPDPKDQIWLMSSGPFVLAPDSTVTILFAVLFADWRTPDGGYMYRTPDSALALVDKWAQLYYDMYWFLYAPGIEENSSSAKPHVKLAIKPNPVFHNATVSFALSHSTWVSLKLYNTGGQLVGEIMRGYRNASNYDIKLDTSGLTQGTYFLVLETPTGKVSRSLVVVR